MGAEGMISCSGTITPTMRRYGSRGSSVASHGGRSQGFGEVQRGLVCLRKGEVSSYSFNVENGLLHVRVPGFHVGLQYDTSPNQDS